jgi:hypothetical protein
MYRIAGLEQFDIILSDDALTPAAADSIRKQGVELLLPSDSNAQGVSAPSSHAAIASRPGCCHAAGIRTLPSRHNPTDRSTRTDTGN